MKLKNQSKFEFSKNLLKAGAVICTVTLLFTAVTFWAMASEIWKTDTKDTPYLAALNENGSGSDQGGADATDSYKVGYSVKLQNAQAPANAGYIKMEEAAKIGAQDIENLFGADLSKADIDMEFETAEPDTQQRAQWKGTVKIGGKESYQFGVDALTGDRKYTGKVGFSILFLSGDSDTSLPEPIAQKATDIIQKSKYFDGRNYMLSEGGHGNTNDADFIEVVGTDTASGAKLHAFLSDPSGELLVVNYISALDASRRQTLTQTTETITDSSSVDKNYVIRQSGSSYVIEQKNK